MYMLRIIIISLIIGYFRYLNFHIYAVKVTCICMCVLPHSVFKTANKI